jgi:hypothetical protein
VTGFRVENLEVIEERWDRVEPWTPSAADLAGFEGTYRSDDAETTFVVTVDGSGLQLWQRPNDTRHVEPLYEDGFQGRGWVVRFRRGTDGAVDELSLSLGRVYDMRFARVEGM